MRTERIAVVGSAGTPGANGTNGTNGTSSTTTTTASYVQPAVGSTVSVAVLSSAALIVGAYVYVAGGGYYVVTAVPDATHATLRNPSPVVPNQTAAGATVATSALIGVAGPPGPLLANYTAFDANHVYAWSLGDVAGTTTVHNEGSGATADLAVTGATFGVPWTGTPSGTVAQFVSTSSNKLLGTSTALTMPTFPLTVECVFQPQGSVAATQFLFEKFGVFGFSLDSLKNVVATINIGGSQVTVSVSITGYTFSGRTHHVMLTYDGTNLKLYVDGFLVNTVAGTAAVSVNASAFAMGYESNSANQYLQGKLAMCAVSNIARPQSYAQNVTARIQGYARS